jgi:small subunit ribosomal protein S17
MTKKILAGVVVARSEKTISVEVERKVKHRLYLKMQRIHKKILAHDEEMQANIGDKVEITEVRPVSKRKSWSLNKIVK